MAARGTGAIVLALSALGGCALLAGVEDYSSPIDLDGAAPADGAGGAEGAPGADDGAGGDGTVDNPDGGSTADAPAPRDSGGVDAHGCDGAVDPSNCGRCGHSCLGGTCTNGRCDPVTLANAEGAPEAIGVGSDVYFSTSPNGLSNIWSCPLGGCMGVPEKLVGASVIRALAVDGATLYFGYHNAIGQCPLPAGCPNKTPLPVVNVGTSGEPLMPGDLTLDATNLYWTTSQGAVYGVGKGGSPLIQYVDGVASPGLGIAVIGTSVYFVNSGKRHIEVCPVTGCPGGIPGTFANNLMSNALAAYTGDLYFNSGAQMLKCAGGANCAAPTPLGPGSPYQIAVDGSGVYWTEAGGLVQTCPLTGCGANPPLALATGQAEPHGIALDANAVYWTNSTGGTVMKVAKP
jgi:hypothetical protein